jgi:hypothetical protein
VFVPLSLPLPDRQPETLPDIRSLIFDFGLTATRRLQAEVERTHGREGVPWLAPFSIFQYPFSSFEEGLPIAVRPVGQFLNIHTRSSRLLRGWRTHASFWHVCDGRM